MAGPKRAAPEPAGSKRVAPEQGSLDRPVKKARVCSKMLVSDFSSSTP
jgi:hypothetical protein